MYANSKVKMETMIVINLLVDLHLQNSATSNNIIKVILIHIVYYYSVPIGYTSTEDGFKTQCSFSFIVIL